MVGGAVSMPNASNGPSLRFISCSIVSRRVKASGELTPRGSCCAGEACRLQSFASVKCTLNQKRFAKKWLEREIGIVGRAAFGRDSTEPNIR